MQSPEIIIWIYHHIALRATSIHLARQTDKRLLTDSCKLNPGEDSGAITLAHPHSAVVHLTAGWSRQGSETASNHAVGVLPAESPGQGDFLAVSKCTPLLSFEPGTVAREPGAGMIRPACD